MFSGVQISTLYFKFMFTGGQLLAVDQFIVCKNLHHTRLTRHQIFNGYFQIYMQSAQVGPFSFNRQNWRRCRVGRKEQTDKNYQC